MDDIRHYDTIHDFINACNAPAKHDWTYRPSKDDGSKDFTGTHTYKEAENLASNGWEHGLKQITNNLSLINKTVEGGEIIKSIAGSHPDIARFIAGMPDCMNRRVITDSAKKPCLDIVLNGSYGSKISTTQIINYGSAIASIIDDLENSGYSISLTVSATTLPAYKNNYGCMLNLKQQGESMDIGKLIFFIAHPSFLRRLAFSHWETQVTLEALTLRYGKISDLPKNLQGDIYFGKHSDLSSCNTMQGAITYVKETIKRQIPDLLQAA